jgi:cytochrome c-type biogenesis protein CcmH
VVKRWWSALGLALCLSVPGAWAGEAAPAAADPVLESRMLAITAELRCLVCQNQTIADSHADLAVDLRNQVRDMLREGQTDQQVIDYMTARYGDFVLYRPPFKATTVLLWIGPPLMALLGMLTLWLILRRRSQMPADLFDPDEAEPEPEPEAKQTRPTGGHGAS